MSYEEIKALLIAKRQFIIYCLIGFSGVGVDLGVYTLVLENHLFSYQGANVCGYMVGTLFSFTMNARYNYRVSDRLWSRFAFFCLVCVIGWSASAGTLHLLVEKLGFNKYLAKASCMVLVVLIQYNLNRLISFRKTEF